MTAFPLRIQLEADAISFKGIPTNNSNDVCVVRLLPVHVNRFVASNEAATTTAVSMPTQDTTRGDKFVRDKSGRILDNKGT